MKDFISAIRFTTIFPLGKARSFSPQKMIPFFPAVGILVGILVALFDRIVLSLWNAPVAALLDVILLAIMTGAFHLDGLGDTADGLYGRRSREKALAIMKDSRIGAMGLLAVVFGISLKWAGIASLDSHRSLLLIIIPAYARGGVLFGIRFLEYGRPEGGTGLDFFKEKLPLSAFWGLGIPVILSGFLGWKAVWLNGCFAIITVAILVYYHRRLKCITGDMLGAMIEITEALLFLLITIGDL